MYVYHSMPQRSRKFRQIVRPNTGSRHPATAFLRQAELYRTHFSKQSMLNFLTVTTGHTEFSRNRMLLFYVFQAGATVEKLSLVELEKFSLRSHIVFVPEYPQTFMENYFQKKTFSTPYVHFPDNMSHGRPLGEKNCTEIEK